MIDPHCHILPATDDGPVTMQTSIAMASMSAADGITSIIATPHTDGINVNRQSVYSTVSALNRELQINKIEVTIYPGFEIPYHLVTELAERHTLADSRYVLVEFPHEYLPQGAQNTLYNLSFAGFKPIIAHPERNADILARPDAMKDLIAVGSLAQITAGSITGEMGPDIQGCALYMLKNNMVHFVGTDSHSPSFRAPVLQKAFATVKKLIGKKEAARIFNNNPAQILQGEV